MLYIVFISYVLSGSHLYVILLASLKAYCGFKGRDPDEPDIATGKWGCGVFNGDPQLKGTSGTTRPPLPRR